MSISSNPKKSRSAGQQLAGKLGLPNVKDHIWVITGSKSKGNAGVFLRRLDTKTVPKHPEAGRIFRTAKDVHKSSFWTDAQSIISNKLHGNNPRPSSGKRYNTDLRGGKTAADELFNELTDGKFAEDPDTGHQVGENGVRLRVGTDGRYRIDIPAYDDVPPETIHFDP